MKRLILAATSVGAMTLALVAGTVPAGASAGSAPRSVRPHTTPALTVTPHANLVNGTKVTVTGSGFAANATLYVTECNADGAGPGETSGSCDLTELATPKTNSSGAFTTTYTIVDGPMKSGTADVNCPQDEAQADNSVECVVGAADLTTKQFAFSAINFAAPALALTYAKGGVFNGKQSYSVTIKEGDGYEPVKAGSSQLAGGYLVIGAVGTAHPASRLCQGSTVPGKFWNPPGYPSCTIIFGETVQINWNGKKIGLLRVGGNKYAGGFTFVVKAADAGKYSIEALGLVSGEELTATADVP